MSQLLYLSRADVEAVALPVGEMIDLLERAFRDKGEGRVEMPPKPGIHPRADAFIHAMPAFIPSMSAAGVKWVSGYPQNQARGLPYISGLIILNDDETGLPTCVMDCTWVTAYRTGAATALAARYLARPESRTVGILACGVQGRTNLEALAAIFRLERVYAYDASAEAQARFVVEMGHALDIEVVGVTDPHAAVAASDLVVTSGPILRSPTPTIQAGWLKPGSFASLVDFDSYVSGAALAEADRIVTDDRPQFEYYQAHGYFQTTPRPHATLEELVVGRATARQTAGERTIAINLGIAMDDMAVAPEILRRARERGIGTALPL
jgi:ornithine cyclodeaminase/alanine dehydrogenase-like protein (mu-crystallin family)